MFSILIAYEAENLDLFIADLRDRIPDLDIQIWPEVKDPGRVEAIITWKPPLGIMTKFPKLKAIISLGAGVEEILSDPTIPPDIPVIRLVDPCVTSRMSEYVLLAVLRFHRQTAEYQTLQKSQTWQPLPVSNSSSLTVGILGLGVLGMDIVQKLNDLDFPVRGWSRTPKYLDGIECFHGQTQLELCVSCCQVIVCLLPLTPETQGILNHKLFAKMPQGGYIINVARGQHLVEQDLLEALDSGQLSGACLDVFSTEPLPKNHPFWLHDQITITPHVATQTDSEYWVDSIINVIHDVRSNRPLKHLANRQQGY
ncbi:MAG: glyoxylate/hydroxypyruvate reductase A [Cyanobacteria bacterium P01_F01_bin.150]